MITPPRRFRNGCAARMKRWVACGPERQRDPLSDALTRARRQRDLAVETSHGSSALRAGHSIATRGDSAPAGSRDPVELLGRGALALGAHLGDAREAAAQARADRVGLGAGE